MNSIVDRFVEKVTEIMVLDDVDIIKLRYAISIIVNEVAKFLIIVILFSMLGKLIPLLFTMMIILPVRITTGGLHFNSNISCFAASLIFFLLSIVLLPQIAMERINYHMLFLICAALIGILPLEPSIKRPIISKNKYLFNKYLSFAFIIISILFILFILNDQYLVRCGIWAFVLQAIQLLLLNIIKFTRRFIS
jgi:Accessory gene regulator B.